MGRMGICVVMKSDNLTVQTPPVHWTKTLIRHGGKVYGLLYAPPPPGWPGWSRYCSHVTSESPMYLLWTTSSRFGGRQWAFFRARRLVSLSKGASGQRRGCGGEGVRRAMDWHFGDTPLRAPLRPFDFPQPPPPFPSSADRHVCCAGMGSHPN